MQEMPNFANIENSTNLTDLSEYDDNGNLGREISDLDKKGAAESDNQAKYMVANHDKLRFDYNLKYISGFAGTGNEITTTLNTPNYVDFTPDVDTALGQAGNIGQIVYSNFANADDNKTVPIPASALSDGKVNLTLQKMNNPDENISVQLFGQADAGTINANKYVKVLGAHASYRSMRYIDDDMSRSFMIGSEFILDKYDENTDLGTINSTTETNNSVNLNLHTKYDNGSNFDTKGFTLYTQIDSETKPTATTISTSDAKTAYDIANNIVNSTQLMAATLGTGKHTVKVYAVDSLKRTTKPIEYTVEVIGKQLKITISNAVSFKDIHYKPSGGYVGRNGKWIVTVTSASTPWSLSVSGSNLQLKGDSSQTIGPMVYRDKQNNEFSLADQKPVIASNSTTTPETVSTDISNTWGKDDGILLKDDSVKPAGHYQGQLNWNLIDSVPNS